MRMFRPFFFFEFRSFEFFPTLARPVRKLSAVTLRATGESANSSPPPEIYLYRGGRVLTTRLARFPT